jgi:hypothetical protein
LLSQLKDWEVVKLECPLSLDGRKLRSLEQEYATNSDDPVIAMSGAWKLRRDRSGLGYDSLISVRGDCVKIVQYRRSAAARSEAAGGENRDSVRMLPQRTSTQFVPVKRSAWSLSPKKG